MNPEEPGDDNEQQRQLEPTDIPKLGDDDEEDE